MPGILVTCPITGRPVLTGIGTESVIASKVVPVMDARRRGRHRLQRL